MIGLNVVIQRNSGCRASVLSANVMSAQNCFCAWKIFPLLLRDYVRNKLDSPLIGSMDSITRSREQQFYVVFNDLLASKKLCFKARVEDEIESIVV